MASLTNTFRKVSCLN